MTSPRDIQPSAPPCRPQLITNDLSLTDHALCERILPDLCASADTGALYEQLSRIAEVPERWLCELAMLAVSCDDARLLEAVLQRSFTEDCMLAALAERTMSEAVQLLRAVLKRLRSCDVSHLEPLLAWLMAVFDAHCWAMVMSSGDDVSGVLCDMNAWRSDMDQLSLQASDLITAIDHLKMQHDLPPLAPSSGYSVETIRL